MTINQCKGAKEGFEKKRQQFITVLNSFMKKLAVDLDSKILIIGGSDADISSLLQIGFKQIVCSNLSTIDSAYEGEIPFINIDSEDICQADQSFDIVFVYDVLHHCRLPHKALCEAFRVARRHVIVLEPNDSLSMRLLTKMRFSFPYEIPAVVDNNYVSGGVRDTVIRNHIYRWNAHEMCQTIASFAPEYNVDLQVFPYWDFNIDVKELSLRKQTRIPIITNLIGQSGFLQFLEFTQAALNKIPFLRKQGNKYFCIISKSETLKPWLITDGKEIIFNRSWL
jgi:SAM-dependent methyltransferase